jgi:hypothetical protein
LDISSIISYWALIKHLRIIDLSHELSISSVIVSLVLSSHD